MHPLENVSRQENVPDVTRAAFPSFLPRYLPQPGGLWPGYLAFAYDLVRELRPARFVHAGTGSADLYFACCQAVLETGFECVGYAAPASPQESASIATHNAAHYASFSHLLQHADNNSGFSPDSIDVLHIQSPNSRCLFELWAPTVKPGGLMLISGIDERESGGDAWQLWAQLSGSSERFAFHHDAGLGVWRKPGGAAPTSALLGAMLGNDSSLHESIRRHYEVYGGYLQATSAFEDVRRRFDTQIAELIGELVATRQERVVLETELTYTQMERNQARRELDDLNKKLEAQRVAASDTEQRLRAEMDRLNQALAAERQLIDACTHSLSWRVTSPLRSISAFLRGQDKTS